MLHRIFIAINLPPRIKKIIASYQKEAIKEFSSFDELQGAAKWVIPENFHVTLEFLGNINDQEILDVINYTKKVALANEPFNLVLSEISFGPLRDYEESETKIPKFIWVRGEHSPQLDKLFRELDKALFVQKKTLMVNDKNLMGKKGLSYFSPHITLARLRQWQFRKIGFDERPSITKNIDLKLRVDSIQVMESSLRRKGPIYTVLDSIDLGSPIY